MVDNRYVSGRCDGETLIRTDVEGQEENDLKQAQCNCGLCKGPRAYEVDSNAREIIDALSTMGKYVGRDSQAERPHLVGGRLLLSAAVGRCRPGALLHQASL